MAREARGMSRHARQSCCLIDAVLQQSACKGAISQSCIRIRVWVDGGRGSVSGGEGRLGRGRSQSERAEDRVNRERDLLRSRHRISRPLGLTGRSVSHSLCLSPSPASPPGGCEWNGWSWSDGLMVSMVSLSDPVVSLSSPIRPLNYRSLGPNLPHLGVAVMPLTTDHKAEGRQTHIRPLAA